MARIISDMIKADNIIEESEIRSMKMLMDRYSITKQEMSEARKVKFSDAVNVLSELEQTKRERFFQEIYEIALSDNVCVQREALLLLALQYCFVNDRHRKGGKTACSRPYLISCPSTDASLCDQYMVYIESEFDRIRNEELQENFKLLVTMSKLYGFNFIYIPKLVEEFRCMERQYVLEVISYMAPNLEESFIENIYDRLCEMTTKDFFHNVLYERLQVAANFRSAPSLLVNIGTSVIPYCATDGSVQYYTEFLCLPIESNTMVLVEEILGLYRSWVSIFPSVQMQGNNGQFKYFGFYKALFDFVVSPPPVQPDLVFVGQRRGDRFCVVFRYSDEVEKSVYFTPKEYMLYYEVAKTSRASDTDSGMKIGTNRTKLAPIVSRIKRKVIDEVGNLSYVDQYLPERNGNTYVLRLDKSKIFMGKEVR